MQADAAPSPKNPTPQAVSRKPPSASSPIISPVTSAPTSAGTRSRREKKPQHSPVSSKPTESTSTSSFHDLPEPQSRDVPFPFDSAETISTSGGYFSNSDNFAEYDFAISGELSRTSDATNPSPFPSSSHPLSNSDGFFAAFPQAPASSEQSPFPFSSDETVTPPPNGGFFATDENFSAMSFPPSSEVSDESDNPFLQSGAMDGYEPSPEFRK